MATTGARSRRSSTSRPRCSASLPISSTTQLTRSATPALMVVRSSDPLVPTLGTVTRKVMRRVATPQDLALVAGLGLEPEQGPDQKPIRMDLTLEQEQELAPELGTRELAAALERESDFRPLRSFILKDGRRGRESRY